MMELSSRRPRGGKALELRRGGKIFYVVYTPVLRPQKNEFSFLNGFRALWVQLTIL